MAFVMKWLKEPISIFGKLAWFISQGNVVPAFDIWCMQRCSFTTKCNQSREYFLLFVEALQNYSCSQYENSIYSNSSQTVLQLRTFLPVSADLSNLIRLTPHSSTQLIDTTHIITFKFSTAKTSIVKVSSFLNYCYISHSNQRNFCSESRQYMYTIHKTKANI